MVQELLIMSEIPPNPTVFSPKCTEEYFYIWLLNFNLSAPRASWDRKLFKLPSHTFFVWVEKWQWIYVGVCSWNSRTLVTGTCLVASNIFFLNCGWMSFLIAILFYLKIQQAIDIFFLATWICSVIFYQLDSLSANKKISKSVYFAFVFLKISIQCINAEIFHSQC